MSTHFISDIPLQNNMSINKETSTNQLEKLLKRLNINDFDIIRKKDLHLTKKNNIIMNLDDYGKGTHWVALSQKHKKYFDSMGQVPPTEVPKNYKYSNIIIEGIKNNDCGQLCCLWLHYINNKTEKDFYYLFKKLYN